MNQDERQQAKAVADYWVRVMDRLHRLQSRAMSCDKRIQKLMRKQKVPF